MLAVKKAWKESTFKPLPLLGLESKSGYPQMLQTPKTFYKKEREKERELTFTTNLMGKNFKCHFDY